MIKQIVEQLHREDALVAHVRLHRLVHDDDLLEAVTNEAQGAPLLLALLVRVQIQGRLDAVAAIAEVGDEVDLEALTGGLTVNDASTRRPTNITTEMISPLSCRR